MKIIPIIDGEQVDQARALNRYNPSADAVYMELRLA